MLIYQKKTSMAQPKIRAIIKIDMIIEFLKEHGGIGYEMYSFTCCQSGDEVSFDIVDVAMDIKDEIDILSREDIDWFPF